MSPLNIAYSFANQCFLKCAHAGWPVQNCFRNFGWNGQLHHHLLPVSKAKATQEYGSKRGIGWLLANELKPGQRGYERQQKMLKRTMLIFPFIGVGSLYFLYRKGLWDPSMWMSSDYFFNTHLQNAEEMKAKMVAIDNELLRLAEVRKNNAETYPPMKLNDNDDSKR